MKNNKKNNIKKRLILLILILVIILFCIKIIGNIEKNNIAKTGAARPDYEEDTIYIKSYYEDRIVPRNIQVLNLYKGNIKRDRIYLKINGLVNILLNISSTKNINEEYFKKNEIELKKYFGNINFEEFEKIVKNTKSKNITEFKYAEILKDTQIVLKNGFAFEMKLTFKEEKEINLRINLNDEAKTKEEQIIFTIIS